MSVFRIKVRSLSCLLCSLLISVCGHALEFDTSSIPLRSDQKLVFLPYVGESSSAPELLLIETPDLNEREKQLRGLDFEPLRTISIYRRENTDWQVRLQQTLDPGMDLVDTLVADGSIRLAGYQQGQLFVLDESTQAFRPVLDADSMFVGTNWDSSPTIEIFSDVNADGRDDFLMPGFSGWQVSLQGPNGFAPPQTVGPPPHMSFEDSARFVGYRARKAYLLDENQDGLRDLAFWVSGRFEVYLQEDDGRFASEPLLLDPDQQDVLGDFLSVSLSEDEESSEENQRMLEGVGDVDGDGLADLIIQTMEGDGIFGLETQYEIHRGSTSLDGRLTFEPAASSIVASGGIQMNNDRMDLTGDGKEEFVITSVNLSIGTLISALITRSASVDVAIFQMHDGVFADKPSLEKEIKVRFNFSTGDLFVPAVLSAEVTGDGRKDLLVQRGLDTLLVYPGEDTPRLFAKSAIRLDMPLPSDRDGFVVADLNQDGRDELILHLERDGVSKLSIVDFRD